MMINGPGLQLLSRKDTRGNLPVLPRLSNCFDVNFVLLFLPIIAHFCLVIIARFIDKICTMMGKVLAEHNNSR